VDTISAIASTAEARGIRFLLAGGHAVIAHGFPRSTFDLDLIIPREEKQAWLGVAEGLGYRLHHEGPAFMQFDAPEAETFPLDLMLVGDQTFEKLWMDAIHNPAWPSVRIVSLLNLLALKCHAVKHGHPGRVVKDADDVIRLIQANNLNPEAPNVREVFNKHGTEEFYEKVRRACART
jgi:hypothetical protein